MIIIIYIVFVCGMEALVEAVYPFFESFSGQAKTDRNKKPSWAACQNPLFSDKVYLLRCRESRTHKILVLYITVILEIIVQFQNQKSWKMNLILGL